MSGAKFCAGDNASPVEQPQPQPQLQAEPPKPLPQNFLDHLTNRNMDELSRQSRCNLPKIDLQSAQMVMAGEQVRSLALQPGTLTGLCLRAGGGIESGLSSGTPEGGIGHTLTVGKVDPTSGGTAVTFYGGLGGGLLSPGVVVGVDFVVIPPISSRDGTQILFSGQCSAQSNSNGLEGPNRVVCRAKLYAKWR